MQYCFLFLRSLLFFILMTLLTVIWSFVCILFSPFPYTVRYYVTSRWNVMVIWMAKIICGIRYQVKGIENFPDTPVIVLSKHQSSWETIFLLQITPRPLVFVFKKSLIYLPFFGWGLGLLRMIPIDRSKGSDAFSQVVKHGRKRLADGQWIIMFPEGTRIPVGQRSKYKNGGARLAIETNTPVLPIAHNAGEYWPKNSFIKKPGLITVSIGKPIYPQEMDSNTLMRAVEDWIESEVQIISPHIYSQQ